jgi:hypothetical protein
MAKEFPRLSYFYAVEENPSRDGHHIHAMFGDAKGLYRKEMWEGWFHRFGRATIEPVRGKADVADYCAKYVCKNDVWWNVKLQWHRQQKLHNRDFVLRPEEGLPTGWDCTSSV